MHLLQEAANSLPEFLRPMTPEAREGCWPLVRTLVTDTHFNVRPARGDGAVVCSLASGLQGWDCRLMFHGGARQPTTPYLAPFKPNQNCRLSFHHFRACQVRAASAGMLVDLLECGSLTEGQHQQARWVGPPFAWVLPPCVAREGVAVVLHECGLRAASGAVQHPAS